MKNVKTPKRRIFFPHSALIFLAILCVCQDFLTQSAAILAAEVSAEARFRQGPGLLQYLCSSGTLLGALPLLGVNEALRGQAGGLFLWKLGVLLAIVFLSVKVYRPFCQYLCPLGAIYGWFNRFSLVQIYWEKDRCTSCGACEQACPAALSRQEISRSPECIRCGQCVDACPEKCLHFSSKDRSRYKPEESRPS